MSVTEDSSQLQTFLDRLNDGVDMFGISLTPSKCITLLHDWIDSNSNPVLAGGQPDEMGGLSFRYLFHLVPRA